MSNVLLFLCLLIASAAFPAPVDSGAAPRLPPRIQAILAGKPRGKDLPDLIEFTEVPAFRSLSLSDRLAVLNAINRRALAVGDFDAAARAVHLSVPLRAESVLAELRRKSADGYASNRARLTTIPGILRKQLQAVAGAAVKKQDWTAASVYAFQCLSVFPNAPDARATARTAGRAFLKTKPADPVRAIICLLRALDTGLDRCFVGKARLAVNQTMLNGVSKSPSLEFTADCLKTLRKAVDTASDRRRTSAPLAWIAAWHEALLETYTPAEGRSRNPWDRVVETAPSPVLSQVARCAQAREHLRRGRPAAAIRCLRERLPEKKKSTAKPGLFHRVFAVFLLRRKPAAEIVERVLAAHRAFLRGLAFRDVGDHSSAVQSLVRAEAGPDTLVADAARFEQARILELAGDWNGAAALYRKIQSLSPAWRRRERAECSLRRLAELRKLRMSPPGSMPVAVLPDDRTSHGDWFYAYGRTRYVLCAQHHTADRTGGGKKLRIHFSTTDPKEINGRLWVSKEAGGEDPAAPWDPVRKKHFPANRDDRGEQYPLGHGPDLIATLDVPPGNFILSFYFVNDHNFYEDNRRFTLELQDGRRALLALADVRDFGGGVYKRFTVRGPRKLRCRIRRDMSLNALLSGVFLDPFNPLRPVPDQVLASTRSTPSPPTPAGPFLALLKAYLRRRQLFLVNGLRVGHADVAEVAEIAMQAEGFAGHARASRRWGVAAAAGWIECECRAFLGQIPRAEKAFDEFLDDFARALPPKDILSHFQQLARNVVITSPSIHRPLIFRIGVCKSGTHRLSRLWLVAFKAAEKATAQNRDNPDVVEAIARSASSLAAHHFPGETAEAKELAAAFLEEHPAPPIRAPEAWLVAGRLWDEQGGPERAVQALRRAITLAGPQARPVYWSELVQALDHAHHPASEVRTAFVRLLDHTHAKNKRFLRPGGALHMASALMREKQYAAALRWLEKYAPADSCAEVLAAECRKHLAANRRTATKRPVRSKTHGKNKTRLQPKTVSSHKKGGTGQ